MQLFLDVGEAMRLVGWDENQRAGSRGLAAVSDLERRTS